MPVGIQNGRTWKSLRDEILAGEALCLARLFFHNAQAPADRNLHYRHPKRIMVELYRLSPRGNNTIYITRNGKAF